MDQICPNYLTLVSVTHSSRKVIAVGHSRVWRSTQLDGLDLELVVTRQQLVEHDGEVVVSKVLFGGPGAGAVNCSPWYVDTL